MSNFSGKHLNFLSKFWQKVCVVTVGFLLCLGNTYAVDLELTQGINAQLPIGINQFGVDAQSQALQEVIHADLTLTGQFRVIDSSRPSVSAYDWQKMGADSVLSGKVIPLGGRYAVSYQLQDPAAGGRVLLAKSYQVAPNQLHALAHHISDEVYQKLTGERGVFSTRIAYILVQRHADKTSYSLEVADMDSSYPQSLLTSTEPIMSPTWSPDGQSIAYVSFEKKRAQIYSVAVASGQRRLLTDFPGINGAPAWSPDGRQMAVVLSKGGSPKIYLVDLGSGSMRQVSFGDAIDTEPRYSPDGRSLLFTSGRGGSPQIYSLSLSDGKIARLTYDGNYNARASFTPNQQQIVMLHRQDHQFNIGVQAMGADRINLLTHSPMDESPSLAPNGRLIVYATSQKGRGVLGIVSIDGRASTILPPRNGDIQEPAWSPYLG